MLGFIICSGISENLLNDKFESMSAVFEHFEYLLMINYEYSQNFTSIIEIFDNFRVYSATPRLVAYTPWVMN